MNPSVLVAAALGQTVTATLVADLRNDAFGTTELRVDNSVIFISSRRINRVVALGPRALPALIREMRRPDGSVDTFARCYSACDQILRKAGLKTEVRWHGGGLRTAEPPTREIGIGQIVGTGRGDGFSEEFRREQIGEIAERAKEVGITLRVDPSGR